MSIIEIRYIFLSYGELTQKSEIQIGRRCLWLADNVKIRNTNRTKVPMVGGQRKNQYMGEFQYVKVLDFPFFFTKGV